MNFFSRKAAAQAYMGLLFPWIEEMWEEYFDFFCYVLEILIWYSRHVHYVWFSWFWSHMYRLICIGIGRSIVYRPIIGFADMKIRPIQNLISIALPICTEGQKIFKIPKEIKRKIREIDFLNEIDFFKVKFPKMISFFFKKIFFFHIYMY